jgi:hypothetical protein
LYNCLLWYLWLFWSGARQCAAALQLPSHICRPSSHRPVYVVVVLRKVVEGLLSAALGQCLEALYRGFTTGRRRHRQFVVGRADMQGLCRPTSSWVSPCCFVWMNVHRASLLLLLRCWVLWLLLLPVLHVLLMWVLHFVGRVAMFWHTRRLQVVLFFSSEESLRRKDCRRGERQREGEQSERSGARPTGGPEEEIGK